MSVKSSVWHSKAFKGREHQTTEVYLQRTPAGFCDDTDEAWFSLETITTDHLQLPESQMRQVIGEIAKCLSLATDSDGRQE